MQPLVVFSCLYNTFETKYSALLWLILPYHFFCHHLLHVHPYNNCSKFYRTFHASVKCQVSCEAADPLLKINCFLLIIPITWYLWLFVYNFLSLTSYSGLVPICFLNRWINNALLSGFPDQKAQKGTEAFRQKGLPDSKWRERKIQKPNLRAQKVSQCGANSPSPISASLHFPEWHWLTLTLDIKKMLNYVEYPV